MRTISLSVIQPRRILALSAAAVLTALVIVGVVLPSKGYAQAGAGRGLEISPPLIDKQLDPGTTTVLEIRVRNVTSSRVIARPSVNDFTAQGEEGQPRIITDDSETSPYSIKPWITNVPSLDLDPGESETAKINMVVPANASPGAHYGVVRFTAVAPDTEDSGVALSASIGTLVLANINGDATTSAQIEEMFVSQNGQQKALFEYGPLTFTERIKNTGNVYFKPVGTLRVKNVFGKEVASLKVNEKRGNVLPGTIRRFEQTLSNKYMLGRYTAELSVLYGDSNQTLNSEISFWVIPYKAIAISLAILIAVFFAFRHIGRSYKKRLMKQIQKQK